MSKSKRLWELVACDSTHHASLIYIIDFWILKHQHFKAPSSHMKRQALHVRCFNHPTESWGKCGHSNVQTVLQCNSHGKQRICTWITKKALKNCLKCLTDWMLWSVYCSVSVVFLCFPVHCTHLPAHCRTSWEAHFPYRTHPPKLSFFGAQLVATRRAPDLPSSSLQIYTSKKCQWNRRFWNTKCAVLNTKTWEYQKRQVNTFKTFKKYIGIIGNPF